MDMNSFPADIGVAQGVARGVVPLVPDRAVLVARGRGIALLFVGAGVGREAAIGQAGRERRVQLGHARL